MMSLTSPVNLSNHGVFTMVRMLAKRGFYGAHFGGIRSRLRIK